MLSPEASHVILNSFHKYLLNSHCVPRTMLEIRKSVVSKEKEKEEKEKTKIPFLQLGREP